MDHDALFKLLLRNRSVLRTFLRQSLPQSHGWELQLRRKLSKVRSDTTRERLMQLTNPFIEIGRREGFQVGMRMGIAEARRQGVANLVLRQLSRRLGPLPVSQMGRIWKLELIKIEALAEALLEFTSRADLARWLRQNVPRQP